MKYNYVHKNLHFEFYLAMPSGKIWEKQKKKKNRETINALTTDISNFRSCVICPFWPCSTARLNTFPDQHEGIPRCSAHELWPCTRKYIKQWIIETVLQHVCYLPTSAFRISASWNVFHNFLFQQLESKI